MPVLHLIAGPHGVGKTTLFHQLVAPRFPGLPFVDAQAYATTQLQHVQDDEACAIAAREWADAQWQIRLAERVSFAAETGLSHPSRLALIGQARALGFEVVLYAMGLDEPRTLLRRVNQRVREGGHAVPSHKLLARYARTLDHLRHAVFMADLALLFDGLDADEEGPRFIATLMGGQLQLHTLQRPRWADRVLGFAEA
jgi:predicted ABC-type ATPase